MLIIGDQSKTIGKVPWVTFSLIAINILVFCAQRTVGDSLTLGFSLIPKEISTLTDLTKPEHIRAKVPGGYVNTINGQRKMYFRDVWITIPQAPGPFPIYLTLFTSMFLHGSWMHLIGNMWFLAVFGRNVECALNHGRFLAFYVACGVVGGLVYTTTDAQSVIPSLGASGAISGVLGAYVAINPFNPISIWLGFLSWMGLYMGVIRVPAIVVIGLWFLLQYVAAFQSLEYAGTHVGGTAYWDHVGGFLAGLGIIRGTILYLRWKMANEPAAEEEALCNEPREQDANDPYAACLPAHAMKNEE